jgi:uncharacterized protein (DUF1778 family)
MTNTIEKTIKDEKIEIRVTKSDKELIHNAAKENGMKPTKWVLETLIKEAKKYKKKVNRSPDNPH